MCLLDKTFQILVEDFVGKTSFNENYYACNYVRSNQKQVSFKTLSSLDLDGVFTADVKMIRNLRLVKYELIKKVNLRNCLPVFRKLLFKIIADEKIEEFDQERVDWEGRGISIRPFWSFNSLQINTQDE